MGQLSGMLVWISIAASLFSFQARPPVPKSVADESRWDKLTYTAPAECEDTPENCAVRMLKELNFNVGDSRRLSTYHLGEKDGKSITVVFVSIKIEGDDSVAGILYRVALSLGDVEDRSYSLEFVGKQYKCMRGRTNWSNAPCP